MADHFGGCGRQDYVRLGVCLEAKSTDICDASKMMPVDNGE